MSEIPFKLWANQFAQALSSQNTQNCIEFFDMQKILVQQINQITGLNGDSFPLPIQNAVGSFFKNGDEIKFISQIMKGYLTTLKIIQKQSNAKSQTEYSKIFNTFNSQCYQPFYQKVLQFDHFDGMWVAPFLDHLTELLCKFALLADSFENANSNIDQKEESDDESENQHIKLAQQEMNKLNQQLRSSKSGADSRKFAQFFIHVRIVRVWFKLNSYKQCNAIFQVFEQTLKRLELNFQQLPMNLTTIFFYFKGRYHLYNNEYQSARINLRMAHTLAVNTQNQKNVQKILRYLIPAEMQVGKFPTKELLQENDLLEYYPVIKACLDGQISELENAISQNEEIFIKSGVFLAVEKLRNLTLRNLFKKIAVAIAENPKELQSPDFQDKPYIIHLKIPFKILVKWDNELDMDELECIIANLISMNYIKGYISHENQVLVLAKEIQKAFPQDAFAEIQ